MDNFSEQAKDVATPATQPVAPRWKGAQSRGPLTRLNERCMDLLIDAAATNSPQTTLAVLIEHRRLWIRLDSPARERVAQMPFLIADAQFDDERRWTAITKGEPVTSDDSGLPRAISEALMLEVLMFAWQLANADRRTAIISLGMAASVADAIAALTPQAIRDIARQECGSVQLRWTCDLRFWGDLLLAAQNADEEKLSELSLQAGLLLCSVLAKIKK